MDFLGFDYQRARESGLLSGHWNQPPFLGNQLHDLEC